MTKKVNTNDATTREFDTEHTCIESNPYCSQAKGYPISRGDMISFFVLMSTSTPDGTELQVDGSLLFVSNETEDDGIERIKIIDDDTLEVVALFTETESWYSEWAQQPCHWIGYGNVLKDPRDVKY